MSGLHKNSKKGFTLIEMVTVVAIVAIMLAVGIPAMGQYIQNANIRTDMATALNIENALKVSASEIKTGRATTALKNEKADPVTHKVAPCPTVEGALVNMKQDVAILKPLQTGLIFYYDKVTQTVTASTTAPSATATALLSTTTLSALSLV